MTGARLHDTSNPFACCDRCNTAELGRRSRRVPVLRYSQTASSGQVRVVGPRGAVAVLVRDRANGWHVSVETDFYGLRAFDQIDGMDSRPRREALAEVLDAYTSEWRAGTIR